MDAQVLLVVSFIVVVAALAILSIRRKTYKGTKPILSAGIDGSALPRPSIADDPGKPVVRILYGTQTGTAERFSKQLGNELRSRYGDSTIVDVRDVETYKPEQKLATEKLVLFCMATYGDGEPTDNAAVFYSWLLKEAQEVEGGGKEPFLQGVAYAVFGLGNKQYEHFNEVGKKVYKSLKTCGAMPIVRRGDGDDDGVIDDDFEKWCAELLEVLDKSDLVGKRVNQNGQQTVPVSVPAYDVEVVRSADTREVAPFPSGSGKDVHSPFWAKITTVRELHTSQSDRSCVHVEVDVSGSGITYEAGDHIALFAQNSEAVVKRVADVLCFDLDALIVLSVPKAAGNGSNGDLPPPFPGPITIRTALSYFADVLSSPHRDALLALSTFAADREEAARLALLASPQGKQEYIDFIGKPHRSLLEVLQAFPSAKPTIGAFFGCIAPRLQPRFYSISSSPKLHHCCIHVTCAVVRDLMSTGRVHEGVCSTWLKRHGDGAAVPVFVRHSQFKLPQSPKIPIIMVGPGTGLAPFRGFLQERAALLATGMELGPAHLFYGCRSRHHDYIYQEELEAYVASGVLSNLHLAFSRDQSTKDYVQHHVERQAAILWPLISECGAHLYVCGDAKNMAKDVHKAFVGLVQTANGCTGTQAEAVVKELSDSGRYQRDVW